MQTKDETALIKAARSLDSEALTEIFEEYAPALFKYLLRLGVNAQEADQLVGDVFARLLEKVSEGKGPEKNLRSYLFQISYHLVVDDSRDRQRITGLDAADTIKEDVKPVQAQAEEKMLLDKVSMAMKDHLTDDQRNVLVLRFQEDFSLKETAEIIGKNVNAVKALQNRAINSLRYALSRENGGEQ
jgi:RNA polymerase sigma-70 factor (ECF subfamily)